MVAFVFILAAMPQSISAYTGHTQDEAVNWVCARGNEGWCRDVDGYYGCQCVDLILAYYDYLVGYHVSGNACDYANDWGRKRLPDGWKRVYSNPQPGDIVVWGPGASMGGGVRADGTYGHIGIVWRINPSGTISTIETNAEGQSRAGYRERSTANVSCYMRPDFITHVHKYSGRITKQATCTQAGVKTFTCSCGGSYTETIAATGHKYVDTVIKPTVNSKGYTLHMCSKCSNSYKDNYTEAPVLKDGWYQCSELPSDITADKYMIEYNNYYEKIQSTSPGMGWENAGKVQDEWKNSGGTYTSNTDLPTSETRTLVSSVYYHFCGPNAGDVGNYEQSGNFVHYDEIPASWVSAQYLGTDNGRPYYFLYWSNGVQVWCKTGDTCDGSYGYHGIRCRAWYKLNTYQNKTHVVLNKYIKESGWGSRKDITASKVTYRYKKKAESAANKTATTNKTDTTNKADTTNKTSTANKTGTTNKTSTTNKTAAANKTKTAAKQLKTGTVIKNVSGGIFKVTGKGCVEFVKPVKAVKTYTVPAKITKNGFTYQVTSVAANAFKNNNKLVEVTIPNTVKTIGANAFYGCTKLKNVKLGSGVTKIGSRAFYNCKKLTSLTINSAKLTAKTVGGSAFTKAGSANYKKLKVKVPKAKKNAYKKLLQSKGLSAKAKIG